jgi:hypothetical protein
MLHETGEGMRDFHALCVKISRKTVCGKKLLFDLARFLRKFHLAPSLLKNFLEMC